MIAFFVSVFRLLPSSLSWNFGKSEIFIAPTYNDDNFKKVNLEPYNV